MKFRAIPAIGLLFSFAFLSLAQQKPGLLVSTGVPPRTAAEYQGQGQAGSVTIAADFTGHSVATPEATFTTEQYIAFEVALLGKPGDRLILSPDQFSLKVNGKKGIIESSPFGLVFHSLKDPAWEESQASATVEKEKTSINGGGGAGSGAGASDPKPLPPKMPIGVSRAMEQKVQKASLPEGDRPLPQAGLIFFQYGGNVKKITSLELLYNGPAGKAKVTIQP